MASEDLFWYQHNNWKTGVADKGGWKGRNKVGDGGWQTYKNVFASNDGIIYGIDDAGDLYWYKHDGWLSGTPSWQGRNKVGNGGWQAYKNVFASSEGIIYAIDDVGDLYWYQHDGWLSGTAAWKGRNKVGNGGWQAYKNVFASSGGIVYAIDDAGDLYWYRHNNWKTGVAEKAGWTGRNKVGNGGWQAYKDVFASSDGIIYAIDDVGDLYWYQHDGWLSGTADWKGRNKVGNGGWQAYRLVLASSGGIVYGIGAHLASTKPAFPIKGSRHDDVAGGHMQTDFTLDAGGTLSAVTRWWTNVKLTGFTGSVTVVLTDGDGRMLWAANPQTHGVDGEWVGDDDRYENWSASVPSTIIDQVRGYAILQQHEPRWRIFDKGEQFLTWLGSDEGKQTIGAIVSIIAIAA